MKNNKGQWIKAILLSAVVSGALTLTAASGILDAADLSLSDRWYQSRSASDGKIVLVGIDQRALEEIGTYSQWGRDVAAMALEHRMDTIRLLVRIAHLEGRLDKGEYETCLKQAAEAKELTDRINTAGFVTDEMLEQLGALKERTYKGEDGKDHPWLSGEEYHMLSQIHFFNDLAHVREWAAAHHEYLDDPSYKRVMPVEQALSDLQIMAEKEGKLDQELTGLFLKSRCWEESGRSDCVTL